MAYRLLRSATVPQVVRAMNIAADDEMLHHIASVLTTAAASIYGKFGDIDDAEDDTGIAWCHIKLRAAEITRPNELPSSLGFKQTRLCPRGPSTEEHVQKIEFMRGRVMIQFEIALETGEVCELMPVALPRDYQRAFGFREAVWERELEDRLPEMRQVLGLSEEQLWGAVDYLTTVVMTLYRQRSEIRVSEGEIETYEMDLRKHELYGEGRRNKLSWRYGYESVSEMQRLATDMAGGNEERAQTMRSMLEAVGVLRPMVVKITVVSGTRRIWEPVFVLPRDPAETFSKALWDAKVDAATPAHNLVIPDDTAYVGRIDACNWCGKEDAELKKCGACGTTRYCSRACQKKHWPNHKPVCIIRE